MVNKEYEDYWGTESEDEEAVAPIKNLKLKDVEEAVAEEEEKEQAEETEEEEEAEEVEEPIAKKPIPKPKPKPVPVKAPAPVKDSEPKFGRIPAQQEAMFLELDGERILFDELPIRTFLEVREIKKLLEK